MEEESRGQSHESVEKEAAQRADQLVPLVKRPDGTFVVDVGEVLGLHNMAPDGTSFSLYRPMDREAVPTLILGPRSLDEEIARSVPETDDRDGDRTVRAIPEIIVQSQFEIATDDYDNENPLHFVWESSARESGESVVLLYPTQGAPEVSSWIADEESVRVPGDGLAGVVEDTVGEGLIKTAAGRDDRLPSISPERILSTTFEVEQQREEAVPLSEVRDTLIEVDRQVTADRLIPHPEYDPVTDAESTVVLGVDSWDMIFSELGALQDVATGVREAVEKVHAREAVAVCSRAGADRVVNAVIVEAAGDPVVVSG